MANMFSLMNGAHSREALVEELIQSIVQHLPVVVRFDEHRLNGLGRVPGYEVEPRLCPSLQICSDFGPGPDTGIMGPARPVTVKVPNQELVIADNLKHYKKFFKCLDICFRIRKLFCLY